MLGAVQSVTARCSHGAADGARLPRILFRDGDKCGAAVIGALDLPCFDVGDCAAGVGMKGIELRVVRFHQSPL